MFQGRFRILESVRLLVKILRLQVSHACRCRAGLGKLLHAPDLFRLGFGQRFGFFHGIFRLLPFDSPAFSGVFGVDGRQGVPGLAFGHFPADLFLPDDAAVLLVFDGQQLGLHFQVPARLFVQGFDRPFAGVVSVIDLLDQVMFLLQRLFLVQPPQFGAHARLPGFHLRFPLRQHVRKLRGNFFSAQAKRIIQGISGSPAQPPGFLAQVEDIGGVLQAAFELAPFLHFITRPGLNLSGKFG